MAAGAAALVGRLQDRRAGGDRVLLRRAALVDDRIERGGKLGDGLRRLHRLSDARRKLAAVGLLLQVLDAVLALGGGELFEIDEHRRAVVLAGLDRERRARGGLDCEAHHGLVDRADLLDIERAVGQPLARAAFRLQRHQSFEDAQNAAVGDRRARAACRPRLGAPFEERKLIRIEQLAAARLHEMALVPLVDQPEQREQAPPAAAPLVHGVGIERGILDEARVEAAHRIAASRRFARARPSVREGRRSRSSA